MKSLNELDADCQEIEADLCHFGRNIVKELRLWGLLEEVRDRFGDASDWLAKGRPVRQFTPNVGHLCQRISPSGGGTAIFGNLNPMTKSNPTQPQPH